MATASPTSARSSALNKVDAVPAEELDQEARGAETRQQGRGADAVRRHRRRASPRRCRALLRCRASERATPTPPKERSARTVVVTETLATARRLVVKIGSALLVDETTARSAAPGSTRWPTTSRACRKRGQEVLIVSSGAIAVGRRHLGLTGRRAEARGEAGRRRHRPDPARACLSGGAGAARHHRRAGPADARRHRGAPPLSQRARDASSTLLALGAVPVINENDTVATARDPLRRQRPARRARRADDQRRHAGAALRHRRALHRRSAPRPDARATSPRCARSRRRSRRWRAQRRAGYSSRRHGDQARSPARIAMAAGCRMVIAKGETLHPLQRHRGRRALHLVPARGRAAAPRASAGSRARSSRRAR